MRLHTYSLGEQIRSPPSAFLVDPFADVSRTVSEFDAICFTHGEQVHGIAVNQIDLLEIDGEEPALLIDCDAKDVDVASCYPAEDAQDRETALDQHSVDSARHLGCAFLFACPLVERRRSMCPFLAMEVSKRTAAANR